MLEKIREKLLAFISSPKDVPLLAGFSVGLYMLLFYYAANYSLASSSVQLIFFTGYYIVLPMTVLYGIYAILGFTKFSGYRQNFLFIGMIAFFAYYLIELNYLGFSKKIAFAGIVVAAVMLSFKIKKYYKLLIILLLFMSLFNFYEVGKIVFITKTASNEWKMQPDNIESIAFKQKPNIYYIQPDGYANAENLEGDLYNFDNIDFKNYLVSSGFTIYPNFRSNYYSTLLSNSSMFSMKHHYSPDYMDPYGARDVIVGDNPVLKILRKNGYKTHFLSERPYLVISRPEKGYDTYNFQYDELPYFMDGWDMYRDVFESLKKEIVNKPVSGNFYFIESFLPGHISNTDRFSEGVEGERKRYLSKLKEGNLLLKKMVAHISQNDPNALIIIGADHGGFVGFTSTEQSNTLINKRNLASSMFGAHLSIKWNDQAFKEYDINLRSSVNIFRTVFSYLAQDKRYLQNLQENSSYVRLKRSAGLYRYIDDAGNVIFKNVDEIQD